MERLYKDAQRVYEKDMVRNIQVKMIKEEESAANFPFHPQVQATTSKLAGEKRKPPIYKRVDEVQKEKAEQNERLRQEWDMNNYFTYKPNINPTVSYK